MKYSLAVFDMDGTILDTLDDLTNTLNLSLEEAGLPLRTKDEVRSFVGNGVGKLIERALPEDTPARPRRNAKSFSRCSRATTSCIAQTSPAPTTECPNSLRRFGRGE